PIANVHLTNPRLALKTAFRVLTLRTPSISAPVRRRSRWIVVIDGDGYRPDAGAAVPVADGIREAVARRRRPARRRVGDRAVGVDHHRAVCRAAVRRYRQRIPVAVRVVGKRDYDGANRVIAG